MEGQHDNSNSNSGVIAAIQEMANAIRGNNNHQENAESRVMRIQGEFRKSRPPVFRGIMDPMIAEEWLRQITRSMNNQKVPEDLKVTIACTYLEGQAYHWWESVLSMPNTEITTWAAFDNIFLEKYFPDTVKATKVREFINLLQRDLTVAEYQAKFEELMRFAPNMIPNELSKARRFQDGLRPTIKERVSILKLERYADVVDRALIAEQNINETKMIWETRQPGEGQRNNKRPNFGFSQYRQQRLFRVPQDPRNCYQCGQIGHVRKHCPQILPYQAPQVSQFQFRPQQQQYRAPYQPPQNWQRPPVGQLPQRQDRPPAQNRLRAPVGGRRSGQLTQGRVYAVGQVTEQNNNAVVEGTFLVFNSCARILFDPGATHSFISTSFASILELDYEFMNSSLLIGSPWGGSIEVNKLCRSCIIEISSHIFIFDLMVMEMVEYDVILGMDWLTKYQAILDCCKKRVTLSTPEGKTFSFLGDREILKPQLIFDTRNLGYSKMIAHMMSEKTTSTQIDLI